MNVATLEPTWIPAPKLGLTSAASFEHGLRGLLMMNLVDALFTLFWVYGGLAGEANPIMAEAMSFGPGIFIMMKVALVGLAAILLWKRRDHEMARLAIIPAVVLYAYVFGGHLGFAVGNLLDVVPAVM